MLYSWTTKFIQRSRYKAWKTFWYRHNWHRNILHGCKYLFCEYLFCNCFFYIFDVMVVNIGKNKNIAVSEGLKVSLCNSYSPNRSSWNRSSRYRPCYQFWPGWGCSRTIHKLASSIHNTTRICANSDFMPIG